jgi:hypothetical protein
MLTVCSICISHSFMHNRTGGKFIFLRYAHNRTTLPASPTLPLSTGTTKISADTTASRAPCRQSVGSASHIHSCTTEQAESSSFYDMRTTEIRNQPHLLSLSQRLLLKYLQIRLHLARRVARLQDLHSHIYACTTERRRDHLSTICTNRPTLPASLTLSTATTKISYRLQILRDLARQVVAKQNLHHRR